MNFSMVGVGFSEDSSLELLLLCDFGISMTFLDTSGMFIGADQMVVFWILIFSAGQLT